MSFLILGVTWLQTHRRGDFQWPKMRIPAEEWYQNTRNWLEPDRMRLLYIATDEKDRTFFGEYILMKSPFTYTNIPLFLFLKHNPDATRSIEGALSSSILR